MSKANANLTEHLVWKYTCYFQLPNTQKKTIEHKKFSVLFLWCDTIYKTLSCKTTFRCRKPIELKKHIGNHHQCFAQPMISMLSLPAFRNQFQPTRIRAETGKKNCRVTFYFHQQMGYWQRTCWVLSPSLTAIRLTLVVVKLCEVCDFLLLWNQTQGAFSVAHLQLRTPRQSNDNVNQTIATYRKPINTPV